MLLTCIGRTSGCSFYTKWYLKNHKDWIKQPMVCCHRSFILKYCNFFLLSIRGLESAAWRGECVVFGFLFCAKKSATAILFWITHKTPWKNIFFKLEYVCTVPRQDLIFSWLFPLRPKAEHGPHRKHHVARNVSMPFILLLVIMRRQSNWYGSNPWK